MLPCDTTTFFFFPLLETRDYTFLLVYITIHFLRLGTYHTMVNKYVLRFIFRIIKLFYKSISLRSFDVFFTCHQYIVINIHFLILDMST